METYIYEWEHQITLYEHRSFYKHCRNNVTSDGSKTALPKIQDFLVTQIQTSGSIDAFLAEKETVAERVRN